MAPTLAPKSDVHVLIIGAGITGLVLAHGLQQVEVFYIFPMPKNPPFSISLV